MKVQISPVLDEILSDPAAREKIYSEMLVPRSKQPKNATSAPAAVTVQVNGKTFDIRQLPSLGRKG